jgi:hypothetical protein
MQVQSTTSVSQRIVDASLTVVDVVSDVASVAIVVGKATPTRFMDRFHKNMATLTTTK